MKNKPDTVIIEQVNKDGSKTTTTVKQNGDSNVVIINNSTVTFNFRKDK